MLDPKIKEQLFASLKKEFLGVKEETGYSYRYFHTLRVYTLCEKLLAKGWWKDQEIDGDALLVAAIFHDIGKITWIDKNRVLLEPDKEIVPHEVLGGRMVGTYISAHFEEEFVKKVGRIIAGHHGKHVTEFESRILHDADMLDNQGLLVILRHVTYAYMKEQDTSDLMKKWFDGGRAKILKNLKGFMLEEVAPIGQLRFEKLDNFMTEMKREVEGEDI